MQGSSVTKFRTLSDGSVPSCTRGLRRPLVAALVVVAMMPGMLLGPAGAAGMELLLALPAQATGLSSELLPQRGTEAVPVVNTDEADGKDEAAGPQDEADWQPAAVVEGEEPAEGEPEAGAPAGDEAPPADANPNAAAFNPVPLEQRVAGECVITGEVSNAATLEPIAGAIVTVSGTGREAETDAQGRFRIGGLQPGDYTVEALKLGFELGSAAASPRLPDTPVEVRLSLQVKRSDSGDGEFVLPEEVVVGEYREESAGDLFLDLDVAPTIASGLSSEDFSKASASDAGEALSKITGANVVDGKYAVVRGLSDRYITTTFNNGAITSADPSRKTVQLDLLPTSVLKGMSVAKTYDVSMPGDFGGGTINIETLGMPDERFFSMKYKLGWNSNLEGPFYRHPKRDLPYWGDVDDYVDAPIGYQLPKNATAAERKEAWDALLNSAAFKGKRDDPKPQEKYSLIYGDRVKVTDFATLGFIAAFSHETKDSMQVGVKRYPRPSVPRSYDEDSWNSSVDWSLFLSGFAEFNENHRLQYTHFHKRVAEDDITLHTNIEDGGSLQWGEAPNQSVVVNGVPGYPGTGYGARAAFYGESWETETTMRDLQLNQITGEHRLGDEGPELKWGYTRNNSFESLPNSTNLRYSILDFADPSVEPDVDAYFQGIADEYNSGFRLGLVDPTYEEVKAAALARYPFLASTFASYESTAAGLADQYDPSLGQVPTFGHGEYANTNPTALKSYIERHKISEDSQEMFADSSIPILRSDDNELKLNLGFRDSSKLRKSTGRVYEVDLNTLGTSDLYGPGSIGNEAAVNPDLLTETTTGNGGEGQGTRINDITNFDQILNYEGRSDLTGAYIGTDLHWEWLQFTGGVRWEEENRTYFADPALNGPSIAFLAPAPPPQTHWMPSLALQNSVFGDRLRIGSYFSRTVARPTFFEFLPAKTFDPSTGFIRLGNPALKDTEIENFDLSFSLRLFEKSSLVIAPFHKALTAPIVAQTNLDAGRITYTNGVSGTLQGVEFELELAEFENWSIRTNYTYISSALESYFDRDGSGPQAPLLVSQQYPGQPEHIFNFLLGYDNEDTGWSANLIYNFTGENLLYRRLSPDEPFILAPGFHQLDANLQKTFSLDLCDLTVGLTVKNLLDTATEVKFIEGSEVYENKVYDERNPGRTYYIELKASF